MFGNILFNIFLIIWELFFTILTLPIVFCSKYILKIIFTLSVRIVLFMLRVLCSITYEVRGLENILTSPCIIASKHQSPFETLIFMLLFKNAVFILKHELQWIPFIGLHLKALRMIFINRANGIASIRHIIKSSKILIKENKSIIIFPEGTRTEINRKIAYHPGVFILYSLLSLPVLPIALNTGLFWPKSIISAHKHPGIAIIEILPPILPGLSKEEFLYRLESAIEAKSLALTKKKN
ncbi:lysophospholipid acyltransferase family protein [Wolbachia endosymbiont of Howardula sp.]|uniref:lysophospholipid acyltransferase family protein n=1 Tax=Wolbachia endosymbiont of Howardula sp. TaxID=2916816 RepID=UPI00217D8313|nr:1-acyl-sn-glycerol-3-phosphate acyltransferase [Wolbachia endosymbiont of Howardula sp.]UWI83272.1 1-acyl-sn-glycerol-3-phosphate acyltransferase [Wolbachia endosymbiont of Howardula sp.]